MGLEAEEHDELQGNSDQPDSDGHGQPTNAPQRATAPNHQELTNPQGLTISQALDNPQGVDNPRGLENPQGLAPSDLTALPDESRELIIWLARRKMATLEEMEQALHKKRSLIFNILEELMLRAPPYPQHRQLRNTCASFGKG